jgi:CheY-like chemotaxis protein
MPTPIRTAKEILVVDDDPMVREALFDLLTDEGFLVSVAVNGADALERLRAGAVPPALIVLDLAMPVMDGYGFLDCLHSDPQLTGIPVLVFSATVSDDRLPEGIRSMRKPMDSRVLLATIRAALAKTPG